jgi:hypothetical protein
MDARETPSGFAAREPEQDRRSMPRCAVEAEAVLQVVSQGIRLPCSLVEVSLTGCRLRGVQRLKAGSQQRVEVSFKLRGLAFRLSGVTQWTDDHSTVGIQFGDIAARRRDELAEALCEVEAENIAKAAKEAAEKEASAKKEAEAQFALNSAVEVPLVESQRAENAVNSQAEDVAVNQPSVHAPGALPTAEALPHPTAPVRLQTLPVSAVARDPDAVLAELFPIKRPLAGCLQPEAPGQNGSNSPAAQAPKRSRRERRAQSRHTVDTSAVIYLVNIAARLNGRILDLSLTGCRIHTDDPFPVGIYTRVETEFQLEGLPFRLGGVIQSIHNKNLVGVRFLDLGERKREQLAQLIEEIEEMRDS